MWAKTMIMTANAAGAAATLVEETDVVLNVAYDSEKSSKIHVQHRMDDVYRATNRSNIIEKVVVGNQFGSILSSRLRSS